jgi:hypothetical protein
MAELLSDRFTSRFAGQISPIGTLYKSFGPCYHRSALKVERFFTGVFRQFMFKSGCCSAVLV